MSTPCSPGSVATEPPPEEDDYLLDDCPHDDCHLDEDELDTSSLSDPDAPPQPLSAVSTSRSGLVKAHAFPVCFPDKTAGTCRYERNGPTAHRFRYDYHDGVMLPSEWCSERLGNLVSLIEARGSELAEASFQRACKQEKELYFQRASLPYDGSRALHPERHKMKPARAKELSGRYALCLRLGKGLIATTASFETLAEANALWKATGDARLLVACCNRLDRCWEIPRYNPLYAEFDPATAGITKGEFPWSSWK